MRKVLLFTLLCFSFSFSSLALDTSAQSAILCEASTGRVLYEKNAGKERAIASTTKIMTALLVIENCDLDEIVEIKKENVGVEGTSLYLEEGEKISVRTLLYGLMLRSGNDAAEALARHVAGDIDSFVIMMNERAKELSMNNTNFANPHGLPNENHYSTARDMAKLATVAMENDIFREVVSTRNYTAEGKSFSNHNKLLAMREEIDGVKTGYTKAAGRCLVSSAEKDSLRLVAVTLNDPNDWDDHLKLFEFGFTHFKNHIFCEKGEIIAKLPVAGNGEVNAIAEGKLSYPLGTSEEIETCIFLPRFIYAPVKEGQIVGKVVLMKDNTKLDEVALIANREISLPSRKEILEYIINKIKNG